MANNGKTWFERYVVDKLDEVSNRCEAIEVGQAELKQSIYERDLDVENRLTVVEGAVTRKAMLVSAMVGLVTVAAAAVFFLLTPHSSSMAGVTLTPSVSIIAPTLKACRRIAIEAHEAQHRKQMLRDGWLRFMWRYSTSSKWRRVYEHEADLAGWKAGVECQNDSS